LQGFSLDFLQGFSRARPRVATSVCC